MAKLLLFNKPYRVLSQFRDASGRQTLADFIDITGVYPAGRLDYDSEGLLLLTDNGKLQARIAQPHHKMIKHYQVQVEGAVTAQALGLLRSGILLKDGPARALCAHQIEAPQLWPRHPPIRERRQQTTSWLEIHIDEGRNRQVRRMTAAIGFPTLRLVRWRVGDWSVEHIKPGEYRSVEVHVGSTSRAPRQRPGKHSGAPRRKSH